MSVCKEKKADEAQKVFEKKKKEEIKAAKALEPKRRPGRPRKQPEPEQPEAAKLLEPPPKRSRVKSAPADASGVKLGAKPKSKARAKASPKPKTSPKAKRSAKPKASPSKKQARSAAKKKVAPSKKQARSAAKKKVAKAEGKEQEKEKRKERAESTWQQLKAARIPDLVMPAELGERVSFTCKGRDGKSSIGVILYTSSFYISRATSPEHWPQTLHNLKAPVSSE